ncbi:MAG: hypothetical protein P0Y53_09890 [Candidatus Pseudobacter hemicellulosilyticus]|uniref:Uncharacterized protein n=1 Tax=Candidatus Pseudobacter hemicellulosilyticus TaxID=3121375 RepID=A0AAJ5WWD0_9BACT|nr:MAG: hypothetical protein P0Y53_09890 [Pseudobacter sp.]
MDSVTRYGTVDVRSQAYYRNGEQQGSSRQKDHFFLQAYLTSDSSSIVTEKALSLWHYGNYNIRHAIQGRFPLGQESYAVEPVQTDDRYIKELVKLVNIYRADPVANICSPRLDAPVGPYLLLEIKRPDCSRGDVLNLAAITYMNALNPKVQLAHFLLWHLKSHNHFNRSCCSLQAYVGRQPQ